MSLRYYPALGPLLLLLVGCRNEYKAPVPYALANAPGAGRFTTPIRQATEGVYRVTDGADQFGEQVALK